MKFNTNAKRASKLNLRWMKFSKSKRNEISKIYESSVQGDEGEIECLKWIFKYKKVGEIYYCVGIY